MHYQDEYDEMDLHAVVMELTEVVEDSLQKVNRLEKQVKSLTLVGGILAAVLLVIGLSGLFRSSDILDVSRLTIHDNAGRSRISMFVSEDGSTSSPRILIRDQDGNDRIQLAVGDEQLGIFVMDKTEAIRGQMALTHQGPNLVLTNRAGKPTVQAAVQDLENRTDFRIKDPEGNPIFPPK